MEPKKYFIVTNLNTKEEIYVNTLEDLGRITGCTPTMFTKMTPAELWILGDWQVICDETKPVCTYYYKNLWRD